MSEKTSPYNKDYYYYQYLGGKQSEISLAKEFDKEKEAQTQMWLNYSIGIMIPYAAYEYFSPSQNKSDYCLSKFAVAFLYTSISIVLHIMFKASLYTRGRHKHYPRLEALKEFILDSTSTLLMVAGLVTGIERMISKSPLEYKFQSE
jgi:hypothetical protein